MSGPPSRSGSTSTRPVRDHLGDLGAAPAQLVGDHLPSDVGARQQHGEPGQPASRPRWRPRPLRRGTRPGRDRPSGRGAPAARRCRGRRRTVARRAARARRADDASRRLHEGVDRVGAREHDPVEIADAVARLVERRRNRPAAECGSAAPRSAAAPSESSRRASSAACSFGRVTSMRLPNSGRESNQRRCSRSALTRPTTRMAAQRRRMLHHRLDLAQRAGDGSLRRQRAVVDQRGRLVVRPAVRDQRAQDVRELARAGVADDRAVETRQAVPVDDRRASSRRPRGRGRT